MKTFKIKIAVQSPLQLGYGKADVKLTRLFT